MLEKLRTLYNWLNRVCHKSDAARALRHARALLSYNARNLRHQRVSA